MTAFADYLDLRLAVSELVGRDDITDLMPRFVKAAEARLNKDLRCTEQITSAVLAFTSGVATLPSDFLEARTLWSALGFPVRQATRELVEVGDLDSYAIDSGSAYLYGVTGNRDLDYYAALSTLTASPTTSNWLLQKSPNLYLYAVANEAAKWLKSADLISATEAGLAGEMKDLRQSNFSRAFGNATVRPAGYAP